MVAMFFQFKKFFIQNIFQQNGKNSPPKESLVLGFKRNPKNQQVSKNKIKIDENFITMFLSKINYISTASFFSKKLFQTPIPFASISINSTNLNGH